MTIFDNLPMIYSQFFTFSDGIKPVKCESLFTSRNRTQDPILVLMLSRTAIGSILGADIT